MSRHPVRIAKSKHRLPGPLRRSIRNESFADYETDASLLAALYPGAGEVADHESLPLGHRWEPGHSGLMYDTTTLLVHLREENLTIAIAADAPSADLEAALTQSYGGPSLLELVESLGG